MRIITQETSKDIFHQNQTIKRLENKKKKSNMSFENILENKKGEINRLWTIN